MEKEINNIIQAGPYSLDFRKKTLVMGILNVTPDSFSDGGKFNRTDHAIMRAQELVEQGADIIDIGGESTRPGHEPVTLEDELARVIPVIEAVTAHVDAPVSIDTYKAETARQAVLAGAHIINDVWGAKADVNMAAVAAELKVPIILTHNRHDRNYKNFIQDVIMDLYESISIVKQAGVEDNHIILDPGIGFAKDFNENLIMMRSLGKLVSLGYPVLLGTSRKGFIGKVLNDLPADERMEGTGSTICYGIQQGCQIVRVHDVKPISRMVKMMDALMGKGDYSG